MSTYERMGAPPLPETPRRTTGLAEAEARLNTFVAATTSPHGAAPITAPDMLNLFAADIALVLRELNGLKQFDPR